MHVSDFLRNMDNIYSADLRNDLFNIDLMNYHEQISNISLKQIVPVDIRVHFETAKNLLLYSWFVYRFSVLAEFQAYSAVEFALREKSKQHQPKAVRRGLKGLLDLAIERGWLRDGFFAQDAAAEKVRRQLYDTCQDLGAENLITTENEQSYCEIIASTLPYLRNMIAHGSTYLVPPSSALDICARCAEIINQLFEQDSETM